MTKDSPVEILQYAWEFDIVLDLYKRVKPKTVLEIGSLYGGTIFHWLDKGEDDVSVMSLDLFSTVDFGETIELWRSWQKEDQKLVAMKIDSTTPIAINHVKGRFKDGIDWLFIDGDHTKEGCASDFYNYFQLVSENGYCIFHDIVGENGVQEFWNELKNNQNYDLPKIEICHSKYHLGIGIIQKWKP